MASGFHFPDSLRIDDARLLKPWMVALERYPIRYIPPKSRVLLLMGRFGFMSPGKTYSLSPLNCFSSSNNAKACLGRGTKCSTLNFILSAGIRHIAFSKSSSSHFASISSRVRTKRMTISFKAALVTMCNSLFFWSNLLRYPGNSLSGKAFIGLLLTGANSLCRSAAGLRSVHSCITAYWKTDLILWCIRWAVSALPSDSNPRRMSLTAFGGISVICKWPIFGKTWFSNERLISFPYFPVRFPLRRSHHSIATLWKLSFFFSCSVFFWFCFFDFNSFLTSMGSSPSLRVFCASSLSSRACFSVVSG